MKPRTVTESFTLRAYPHDPVRLREMRDALQQRFPDRIATLADALAFAVSSASHTLANNQIPAAIAALPPPPEVRPGMVWPPRPRPPDNDPT